MRRIAPTKAQTALLEPFKGLALDRIVVPATPAQFAAATAELLAADSAGFDTESKPTFLPGEVSGGPHLVQFALADKAFLFQLHHPESRPCLVALLQASSLRKVGFGLESDRTQIHAKLGVTLQAVVDLNAFFRREGWGSSIGVRAAVGVVLQQRFHKSKKTTTSNWAQPHLTPAQLLYAANDAFAALQVFRALPPA